MAGNSEIRDWARDNGHEVNSRGAIPSAVRAAYYRERPGERPAGWVDPLPSPDDDLDAYEDIGEIGPGGWDEPEPEPAASEAHSEPRSFTAVPVTDHRPDTTTEDGRGDPGPAHGKKAWRRKPKADKPAPPRRVTAGIRGDIHAKIEFALMVPGSVWSARDPICGGTFVQQTPAVAEALTDIVCDSPDLVAFFTGPGGAFMRYLNLGAALMPVVQAVAAHHVYHSIEEAAPEDAQQPAYAA